MDKKTNKKHAAACRGSVGRSISFLRHKARAQKARKLGLLELSASFAYSHFGKRKAGGGFF